MRASPSLFLPVPALFALCVAATACSPTPVVVLMEEGDSPATVDAGAGAMDAGTGSATDGGGHPVTGAIPSPAPLDEPSCRWSLPPATCPGGSRGCLVLHRRDQAPTAVLTQAQLGDDSFHFVPLVTDEHLYFTTYRSVFAPVGAPRFIAMPARGGTLVDLLDLPVGTRIDNISGAAWDPSYGVWFMDELDAGGQRTRTLRLSVGAESQATVTYPGIHAPRTPAVAQGTDYFVAHEDGVYSYYPAGGGRLAEAADVRALAVNGTNVVFAACSEGRCSVHRHDRRAFSTTTLAADIEGQVESLVIAGADVFALHARGLLRLALDGSQAARVVYAGESFPQHAGTLLASSLRSDGDRLYVEQVCYPDADAPEYGTIELDVRSGTAAWLNLRPGFPYLPQVRGKRGAGSDPWINAVGLYAWQHE